MVKSVSKKIINSIATDKNYSKDELEQMEYALVTISFELIKMISLIIIFSLFGYFNKVIIIAIVMLVTKPFIGGYHEDTQFKCFIATMLLTTGILVLSLQCNLSFIGNCILILLSIFCIWNQAPVINPKMPISRPQLIKKNRERGLGASIILGAISIILYNYSGYYSLITWTILFHAVLMFNKRES
ncbi:MULTISPECIES: accessory gene regulator B family protein [unclassified Clostridium]|uniref:accessory gene regulator ArgB-like protein n=1 Tax=unclassified Clostridium TaxID=2614128 RepID=UPI000298264B|nr:MULTISPECIES: accessory gene regulator B family protein [unclassified Clostridium]EKQ55409.1 MAG: post-translational modification of quorum-sensing peptide protein [Clostridium sp. Maddingley MBC34-26]